jgi:ATP-dependent DNA helicase DinG
MAASAETILVPDAPTLVLAPAHALWLTPDGEVEELGFAATAARAADAPPLACHAPAIARRLGLQRLAAFDLLELFAFVRPGQFCLPTPRGLAHTLGFKEPADPAEEALALRRATAQLLREATTLPERALAQIRALLPALKADAWPWADFFGLPGKVAGGKSGGFDVWRRLTTWNEGSFPADNDEIPVEADEARERIRSFTAGAERRPQQEDFAAATAAIFRRPRDDDQPHVVLAEAGTGTGKTLGYLASATLWSERNNRPVWISTFTKNLQSQIAGELDRVLSAKERRHVALRKGRENYLCLLNYEESLGRLSFPGHATALALVARWAGATRDGDLMSGDFPGWLRQLLGWGAIADLTDHRGECVRSACGHYAKCFAERAIRRSARARIVVVNHALVVAQAAVGGTDDSFDRIVFDEAHHLSEVADAAFTMRLTGRETARLRRWIRGGARRARRNGLLERYRDTLEGIPGALEALQQAVRAARVLPRQSLPGEDATAAADFFRAVEAHVKSAARESFYDLEAEKRGVPAALLAAADAFAPELGRLVAAFEQLTRSIGAYAKETDDIDETLAARLAGIARSVERQAGRLRGWGAMLRDLGRETPPAFVDWFAIERDGGRDRDVGMLRSWLDPTRPFAEAILKRTRGAVLTSATLRDTAGDADNWRAAEVRTGAHHLAFPAVRFRVASPFDFASQTRIFVATDLDKNDVAASADAIARLFLAAAGGGLGLFTSIARLRQSHAVIRDTLAAEGLPLLAQHVDGIDTTTLIDMFRADRNSCLLGTDATRDGIDVPGQALRLVVFERVPWPRQTILHKARRAYFEGPTYDDMLVRLRLKQAYGRLIRRQSDQGVFVMLERAFPTRFVAAFPPDVKIVRASLSEIVAATKEFLAPPI